MKRGLLGILAVGMLSSAANAATLRMQFAGGTNEITMAPSDSATIELYIDMTSFETSKSILSGFDMRFDVGNSVPGVKGNYVVDGGSNNKLVVTNYGSPISGWVGDASTPLPTSFDRGSFFFSFTNPSATLGVQGNGTAFSTLIATFTIHKATLGVGDTYIVWRQEDPLPALYSGPANWSNRFGYTDVLAQNSFVHGQGSPGDADPRFAYHGYEAFEPLIIHQVPEPSALALLALGGLAVMRRRK